MRTAVVGASGYAGGELVRLLAGHPHLRLAAVTAGSQANRPLADAHPHLADVDLALLPTDPTHVRDAELVFLAMPPGQAGPFAAELAPGTRVVDLSADFRLADPAQWRRYYPGDHPGTWTYGLPELPGQRARIAAAARVAAAGCYATALALALAPLVGPGHVAAEDVVAVASSGTTGAGRAPDGALLASEVLGDLRAYAVGAHRHTPEVRQATGVRGLAFTPVLAPLARGILATVYARPTAGADPAEALAAAYAGEPFVRALPAGRWPRVAAVTGTNRCHLQAATDLDSGRVVVVSALDNLGKGAAGQAVQCANLMLGLPETAGLAGHAPAP